MRTNRSLALCLLTCVSLTYARMWGAGDTIQFEWLDLASSGAGAGRPDLIYPVCDTDFVNSTITCHGSYAECQFDANPPVNDSAAVFSNPYTWVRFDSIDFGDGGITQITCCAMGKLQTSGGFYYCSPRRNVQIRLDDPSAPTQGSMYFDSCGVNMCEWKTQTSTLNATNDLRGIRTVYFYKFDATRYGPNYDWFTFPGGPQHGTPAIGPHAPPPPIHYDGAAVRNFGRRDIDGAMTIARKHGALLVSVPGDRGAAISLVSLNGTVVWRSFSSGTISTSHMPRGSYIVRARTAGTVLSRVVNVE